MNNTMTFRRNGGSLFFFQVFLRSILGLAVVALVAAPAPAATTKVTLSPLAGAPAASDLPTESASDGRLAYLVVLRDAPLAASGSTRSATPAATPGMTPFRAMSPTDRAKRSAELSQKQDAFETDMRQSIPGFQAGNRFQNVINGMSVLMPAGAIARLRADARVKAVYPIRRYQLHLDTSNPLMNAPAFWTSLGGDSNAGKGVKIADIDTGVDFSNPMFSDSSLSMPAGFPKENDGNHFANSKVIVAKYFQGIIDSTDASLNAGHRTAQDLSGHGSHTASVAAGARVALSGPGQRPVTIEGVAPKAYLGDYRVFAPNAFTDNIIAAIDEAVGDGMDVINMSFGLNNTDGTEPFLFDNAGEFEAIENAVAAGLVVTVSAGNSGTDDAGNPLPDSISSTANVPDVIAVGATTNSHDGVGAGLLAKVSMTASTAPPNLTDIIGAQGTGAGVVFPLATFSATFTDWDSFDGSGDSLGCAPVTNPALVGKIVLIQRGTCTFAAKVNNAKAAGAVGVVLYNSASGGDQLLVPSVDNTTIPSIFVTRTDGLNLKTYLDANSSASPGNFGPAPAGTPPATFTTPARELASFSSIGPTLDFQIKPDLTSVGVGSYAACQNDDPLGEGRFPAPDSDAGQDTPIFDPSGFTFGDGTSFSAPRVAGSAALMIQKHPSWTPAEIKAALMETSARPTDPNDPLVVGNLSVLQRGSGDVDLAGASAAGSVVLPANHSFRQVFLTTIPPAGFLTQTFTIENKSGSPATYAIQASPTAAFSDPAVTPIVSPSSLTLAAGTSGTFTLTLQLGAALQTGQHDSEGAVTVSDGGTTISGALSVPYWIRIQNQTGTPPLLETASAHVDATTLNQIDVDITAHDDDGDIDGFSILFLDSTGQPVAQASDTFGGTLTGMTDVVEELQITGVTPAICPDCVSVSVQLTDSKGFASNTLEARYKPALAAAVPASSGTDFRRVVPLVANTQGAGFFFQSDTRFFNPSFSHPLSIDAFLVPQGQGGGSALHTTHFVLPRESLALNDICLNDFDQPNSVGSLILVSADGSPFLASSRAYTRNSAGTFGTFVPTSTPAAAIGAEDGTATANGFETAAGFHTNVGATEVAGVATQVRVEGFDESGASVGSFTLALLAYSNQQYNPLTDPTHKFTAPAARLDFTVLSGGRVIPYGATVDEGSGDTLLSVAKAQPESTADLFVTEVAHTHGSFNSFLTSDLSITNRSTGSRTFTITLLPAFVTGTPSTPAPITIQPGQTLVFKDVLQGLFGLTGDSGSGLDVHPQSAASLVVSARTSTPNTAPGGSGTYGFFVTGAKSTDALTAGGKKVSIHLAHNAEFRTNFGFTEIAGAPVVVRATYFDEDGTPQGSAAYALGPHATIQTSLGDLLGAGTSANGYLEFTVDSGSGAALPFGAVIDNRTNDLIYVPGENEN